MTHPCWTKVLSAAELDARYAEVAKLDMSFASKQRAFYEGRTKKQLEVLVAQAWNCNDSDGYQLARSHLDQKN
jgi:hypothetical protein